MSARHWFFTLNAQIPAQAYAENDSIIAVNVLSTGERGNTIANKADKVAATRYPAKMADSALIATSHLSVLSERSIFVFVVCTSIST